jgi:Holliday junction resolvase RusA-like endonuclease
MDPVAWRTGVKRLEFIVFGNPAPKGSMRAAGNRVIPSGSPENRANLVSWESAVRAGARNVLMDIGSTAIVFMGVPIRLTAVFRMPRLMSHFAKKGENAGRVLASAPKYPTSKPDMDKLLRTTLDAMTKLVFDDDARVAETLMRKVYAEPGKEGAWILIEQLEDK